MGRSGTRRGGIVELCIANLRSLAPLSASIVAALLAVEVAALAWAWLISFPLGVFDGVDAATRGVISAPFCTIAVSFAATIAILRRRATLDQLGLGEIRRGLGAVLVLWAAMQLGALVFALVDGDVVMAAYTSRTLGEVLTQFVCNAPDEELVYRAVLVPALFHALLARAPDRPRRALAGAFAIATLIFAVSHVPSWLSSGASLAGIAQNLVLIGGFGVCFIACYVLTRNLVIAIGVHALFNVFLPMSIVVVPDEIGFNTYRGIVAIAVTWWWRAGRGE